jgi:hypothetical protein
MGRYGGPLDPRGTHKAVAELARVLAQGGTLFLSLPIGRPRICFNAHRIHDPRDVLTMVPALDLVEFSAVSDDGDLIREASLAEMAQSRYACGLFMLRRCR